MERKIRRKKPWAIAAAAGLLTTFALSAVGNARVYNSVSETTFADGHAAVTTLTSAVSKNRGDYDKALSKHNEIKAAGEALTGSIDRRELWVEVYKAINEAQPRDLTDEQADSSDPSNKNRLKITSITAEKEADLKVWFDDLNKKKAEDVKLFMAEKDKAQPPSGKGYVFTLVGSHYREDLDNIENSDRQFIKNQFLANLQKWTIERDGVQIPIRKAGITHAVLFDAAKREVLFDPNRTSGSRVGRGAATGTEPPPGVGAPSGSGGGGGGLTEGGGGLSEGGGQTTGGGGLGEELSIDPNQFNIDRKQSANITEWEFIVKFVWTPTLVADRPDTEPGSDTTAQQGQTTQ